jgi:hypothetical protein
MTNGRGEVMTEKSVDESTVEMLEKTRYADSYHLVSPVSSVLS